jgi:hypothetical protein
VVGRLQRRAGRRPWLSALVVLGLVACAWLYPVFGGHQLGQSYLLVSDPPFEVGAPPAGTLPLRTVFPDAGRQFHPWQVVAREQVHDGHLPLWNPYEYGGQPLLANMQSALAFPLTWVALVLSPAVAAGVIAILKLSIAGLGAFGLSREVGVRRWDGALVAGIVYMLSAPMVTWLQWPLSSGFAVYPWLLLATHRLCTRPGPGPTAAVAAAVTLTILAGHPESALAALSGAAVYLIALWLARAGRRVRSSAAITTGGWWLLGVVLGLAGAAVAVLPFLDILGDSVTKTTHTEGVTHLPFYATLQYLAPHLFGNGQPGVYGFAFYTSVAGYFGVSALMLALVALWRRRAAPATVALGATALVALMATFGIPPVSWWTSHVPPWSTALLAGRVYFLVALAAAIGAGAGYAALAERSLSPRRLGLIVAAVAATLLLGVVLAEARDLLVAPGAVKKDALLLAGASVAGGTVLLLGLGRLPAAVMLPAAMLVIALSAIDVRGLNVTLPPRDAHPRTPAAIRFLQARPWPFRVQVIRPRDTMAPPNILAEYGLESLEGYDFPLATRWSDLEGAVLRYSGLLPERRVLIGPPQRPARAAMRLFGVRYYLAEPNAAPPLPDLTEVYRGADATVFRDRGALPRAFVVPSTRSLPDDQALAAMSEGSFDPRRVALVPPGTAGAPPGARASFTPARVRRLSPDHLRIELPPDAAGWLVIGNSYSSAWEATVDGRSTELMPTDYAAMGLPVEAGTRVVDVRLDRTRYWVASLISLLAILAMMLLALTGRARRRAAADRAPRPPAPPAEARPSGGSGSGRTPTGRSR